MATAVQEPMILYHYHYSPYAHKVTYYLTLRGLPYRQCPQPPTLPRPDLAEKLGVTYRRIPLLAIGNTVYADTKLILDELERRYPLGALGGGGGGGDASAGGGAGDCEWAAWSDGVFRFAVACLPTSLPVMKDARFRKDREDFSGYSYSPESIDRNRPKALQGLEEQGFRRTERVLADGRRWLQGGDDLALADLNAVWVLEWVVNLPGALAGSGISPDTYPHSFAWVARFLARMGKVRRAPLVTGPDAREAILSSSPISSPPAPDGAVGGMAAKGEGEGGGGRVKVFPTDTGRNHPQRGRLVRHDGGRIELLVTPPGELRRSLRVVFPTHGYRIEGDGADDAKL